MDRLSIEFKCHSIQHSLIRLFTVTISPAAFSKKYEPVTSPDYNVHKTVTCLRGKFFSINQLLMFFAVNTTI